LARGDTTVHCTHARCKSFSKNEYFKCGANSSTVKVSLLEEGVYPFRPTKKGVDRTGASQAALKAACGKAVRKKLSVRQQKVNPKI
jgi:hypothetical protein